MRRMSAARCPTPSATWCVGPSAHQASMNEAGPRAKRMRELVLPMRKVGPGDRLALGGEQLEPAVGRLREAEDRDRPEAHLHLHRQPRAGLAVEQLERAQHRPAVRDRHVPGAVVSHEHEFLVEVERIELGVGAARAQPVEQEHRDVRLEVALARRRDAARGQQRIADDQRGPHPLVDVVAEPAVVVGEAVEREVAHERVEARPRRAPTSRSARARSRRRSGRRPGRRARRLRGSPRPCSRSRPASRSRRGRRDRRSRGSRRASRPAPRSA